MESFEYIVESIDGDYANLRRTAPPTEPSLAPADTKQVARALLPPEITEGTRLHYEWLQYTILSE